MSDIFREIDEELKRDNYAKLWKQYGKYIVALAAIVLIVTAAVVGWRQYQRRLQANEGERVAVAFDLIQQGKIKEAGESFSTLAKDGAPRAVLARLEEAAIIARGGDAARAAASYEAIASDASVEPAFRDLATLLAVQHEMGSADAKMLIERLQPLTAGEGPWRPGALELTALAQLKAGDSAAARASYQKLADDLAAPQGMRTRAAEMATALAP